jgi:hypothetical protein
MRWMLALTACALVGAGAAAADDDDEIVKKLNNPIASLISVPFQNNFDWGAGIDDSGFQYKLNVQPVIPIPLGKHVTLINRIIMPVLWQDDIIDDTGQLANGSNQFGLGDTTASFFFSPKDPGPGGLIWGFGPILLFPTATDDVLGSEKWGAGPTGVMLFQKSGWTYGALASHTWSYTGNDSRADVDLTFLQPFLNYSFPTRTTLGLNSETTYDWKGNDWTVPINLFVTQLVRFGKLPVSFQWGGRYYVERPSFGPHWGLRASVTFVLPGFGG